MIKKIEGIVLNEQSYGDSSKILNVITKDYGIIGILSKGCKKIKSNLRIVSTKLTYGNFNVYYKEDKLSTLISVDVINELSNIKTDIEKISYASYILDLANNVIKQNNNENIYELLISSLIKINEGFDPMVITNILELKYLDYLGVMPVLDSCVVCGDTKSISTISSYKGGYICNSCLKDEKIVSDKTIKLIRMFYYVDISKIEKLEINNIVKNEINNFLEEYYNRYTGLYLKSKEFVNSLKKIK